MRDWPILLTATVCLIGAAVRYVVAGGTDTVVVVLVVLGSASFGAWLYSMGRKDT